MPESPPPRFDPYALLQTLDKHRVTYIVIGGFARVLQGTEEITRGLDIAPSTRPENLRRLDTALRDLDRGRSVSIPGALNQTAAALSSVSPAGITRRVAGLVVKRSG